MHFSTGDRSCSSFRNIVFLKKKKLSWWAEGGEKRRGDCESELHTIIKALYCWITGNSCYKNKSRRNKQTKVSDRQLEKFWENRNSKTYKEHQLVYPARQTNCWNAWHSHKCHSVHNLWDLCMGQNITQLCTTTSKIEREELGLF